MQFAFYGLIIVYGLLIIELLAYLQVKEYIDLSHESIKDLAICCSGILSLFTIQLIQYFIKVIVKGFNNDDVGV